MDEGVVAKAWFEKDTLTGTMLSQLEFSKTHKLIDRLPKVKGAAKAMNHHCSNIIGLSPPDFMIRKFIPDYRVNARWYWAVREGFKLLLQPSFDLNLDEEAKIKARQEIEDYERPYKDIISRENQRLAQRPKIKKLEIDGIKLADFTAVTKKEIMQMLQQHHLENYPNQALAIDENADGWDDLELFINVYTDYHKIFIERRTRKLRNNDFVDLCMTAYVGKNDLYWTNDRFWIDLIKANPITAKYLYPLSGKKRD